MRGKFTSERFRCSPLTFNQVPEDLAMILNDSSLFSNSADITTKEILKRYGDRAKAPTVNSAPNIVASTGTASPQGTAPVVTRVDTDPHQQNAWQNESSVRHVGGDPMTPPTLPYVKPSHPNGSTESHGSPNRGGGDRSSMRSGTFDKQRSMAQMA